MNAPDIASQPRRRGPRGRGAYLWLIKRIPDRYEPQLRDAATTVRHRRLRIRLFRERWIRRSRRSVRRSERAWMRRLRQLARTASRSAARARRSLQLATLQNRPQRQGADHNDDSISQHDQRVAEQLAWTPRGRIARVIFPAMVRFPGDGEFVVIDATGHPTEQIVVCQDHFPQRFLVVTDAPAVGALRTAGIPYEYLPTASANHPAETFLERLLWLDYVYGIDRIERLDHYSANPSANPSAKVDEYPQQP